MANVTNASAPWLRCLFALVVLTSLPACPRDRDTPQRAPSDSGEGGAPTAEGDGSIRVSRTWPVLADEPDAGVGRVLDTDLLGEGQVRSTPSSDGRWIAAWAGYQSATVYDRASGTRAALLPVAATGDHALRFSYDGRRLAASARAELYVFDPAKPEAERLVWRVTGSDTIDDYAWTPDDAAIVWTTQDGHVESLAVAEGRVSSRFVLPVRPERTEWSPDGKRIAVARDGITLVDAATGSPVRTFAAVSKELVLDLAFDPAGKRLAAVFNVSEEAWITVFDVETGAVGATLRPAASSDLADRPGAGPAGVSRLEAVAWSPDGGRIATIGAGFAYVVDVGSNAWKVLGAHAETENVLSVAWSAGGDAVVTGGHGTTVWDLATSRPARRYLDATATATAEVVACSHDGSVVATLDPRLGLSFARIDTGAIAPVDGAPLPDERRETALWASADGTRASYLIDQGVKGRVLARVDRASGQVHVVTLEGGSPTGRAFPSPDGRWLLGLPAVRKAAKGPTVGLGAIEAALETARVWDAETGKLVSRIPPSSVALDEGSYAAWGPRSDVVAISFKKGGVAIVDPRTGARLRMLAAAPVASSLFGNGAAPVLFSADGAQVLTKAASWNTVDVWRTATGQKEQLAPSVDLRAGTLAIPGGWLAHHGELVEMSSGRSVRPARAGWNHYGDPSESSLACAAPDGRWAAFAGFAGPFFLRPDGAWLDLERVPFEDGWATLAIASDGTFDVAPAAALSSVSLRFEGRSVRALEVVARRREGLATRWLAAHAP